MVTQLLYIDPGTGSMLFSVFIGSAAALYFLFRTSLIKIKSLVFGRNKTRQKHKGIVIYNEGNQYWPVFNPIIEEFESRRIDVHYLTSSETDPVFKNNYTYIHPEYIGSGNKSFTTLNFLEADVCLMTTPGLDVYQLKRSKLCSHYSHILHAVGDVTGYRLFGVDYYDSILLSGEYQKDDVIKLEESRKLPKKDLPVVGSTYLDYYKTKIKEISPEQDHVFTVLISPSWGTGSILNSIGDKLLDNLKDSGWRVIVRPHPQSKTSDPLLLKKLERKYDYCIWDYKNENLDSLSKADVMVSDFSSILFDYTFLFDKPIIYYNVSFNKEMYDAGDFDYLPWKLRVLENFGTRLTEEDLSNIKKIIVKTASDNSLAKERINTKEIAWQNRGNSGKTAVDYLVSIKESLTSKS